MFNYSLWADAVKKQKQLNIFYSDVEGYYYLQRGSSMVHQADHRNWIMNAEYMLRKGREENNRDVRRFWLIRTIKRCLTIRYDANVRGDADAVVKAGNIMKAAYRNLLAGKDLKWKERLLYGAMISSPQLYRQFHIRTNSGMIEWERHMKRVRAESAGKGCHVSDE